MDSHTGAGRFLTIDGEPLANVRYVYRIDRTNRVWSGTAENEAGSEPLAVVAGPALLETASGDRAQVHYYHRTTSDGVSIVFTGRGAPPGE